jgi:hypothetical protein
LSTPRERSHIPWRDQPSRLKGQCRRDRCCGGARWKIENESFNLLKNHGYELEHNFGHGQKFLAMTQAALNLLAFAWHTVLELLEPPSQAAREAATKRTSFFAHILMLTAYVAAIGMMLLSRRFVRKLGG